MEPKITPAPEGTLKRQIGFITKGGGLNLEEWIRKEKTTYPNLVVDDYPTHIEFHLLEKKK